MNVTRDVILDLLPLYLAGEASDDTRTLIDDYLSQDPELARIVRQNPGELPFNTTPAPLTKERELLTLERTKTMLRLRSFLLPVALFFTLLPLAGYQSGRHQWAMLSDFPAGAMASGALALTAWSLYFLVKRKLRIIGI